MTTGEGAAVRLVPVDTPRRRQFGALRGLVVVDARFHAPLDDDELVLWSGA